LLFGHASSECRIGTKSFKYPCNKNQFDALIVLSLLANRQSTKQHNTYQLFYIYSIPPDDGLNIWPKHVEVDWRNKLRINIASSWFLLHSCIEMHGQQNIKFRQKLCLL
jgi:hypothetical protein